MSVFGKPLVTAGRKATGPIVNPGVWTARPPRGVQNGTPPLAIVDASPQKIRQIDAKASRLVEDTDETRGEKAAVETDFLEAKAASRDGEEAQPRISAVDSDTGQTIDLSV